MKRFKNNIRDIKTHLKDWQNKIYSEWIDENIKQDGKFIKLEKGGLDVKKTH